MSCFDDVMFVTGFYSGCVVSLLIVLFYYLFDKVTDKIHERKQKKKDREKQIEDAVYSDLEDFNVFCRLGQIDNRIEFLFHKVIECNERLSQIVDYINDNESSVVEDE